MSHHPEILEYKSLDWLESEIDSLTQVSEDCIKNQMLFATEKDIMHIPWYLYRLGFISKDRLNAYEQEFSRISTMSWSHILCLFILYRDGFLDDFPIKMRYCFEIFRLVPDIVLHYIDNSLQSGIVRLSDLREETSNDVQIVLSWDNERRQQIIDRFKRGRFSWKS